MLIVFADAAFNDYSAAMQKYFFSINNEIIKNTHYIELVK